MADTHEPEIVDQRQKLYDAIQASIQQDDRLADSVLLGYVMVAEWKSPEGHSWVTKLSGDAFSELPPWRERMFGQELVSWDLYTSCNCDCHNEPPEEEE